MTEQLDPSVTSGFAQAEALSFIPGNETRDERGERLAKSLAFARERVEHPPEHLRRGGVNARRFLRERLAEAQREWDDWEAGRT